MRGFKNQKRNTSTGVAQSKLNKLKEKIQNLEMLVHSNIDGILIVNNKGVILWANEAAADLFQKPREDLEGSSFGFPIVNREITDLEIKIGRNVRKIVALRAKKIEWKDEESFLCSLRDVTKERKMQDELIQANKLESLGTFAGGVAHDFNNLLTAILGNISLAKMEHNREKLEEFLSDTEKVVSRAKGLTQQLLTFSKGGEPIKKNIELVPLIQNSVEFMLRGVDISFNFDLEEQLCVNADEGQIAQVIQNIILNAREALGNSGNIYIRANKVHLKANNKNLLSPGKYIRIVIEDDGPGIDKVVLDRIFDPFYTTKETGSGLGLSISLSIIKKHGGWINVESQKDKFTRFIIHLPALKNDDKECEKDSKKMADKTHRVLVMDDEKMIRKSLKGQLEYFGHDVKVAKDGTTAYQIFQKYHKDHESYFDVIITDLIVPNGVGGKELTERVRRIDRDVFIVASSGYSKDPIMSNFKKYGFNAILEKPYVISDLRNLFAKLDRGDLKD